MRLPTSATATDPWAVYTPDAEAPWNLERVVHLHRRAGFAATWTEIQRDLKDGPAASVDRITTGRSRVDGQPVAANALADRLTEDAVEHNDIGRLQAAWIYRMLFGSDPLTERVTLMWHDHFATSQVKVGSVRAMDRQNHLLRERGMGTFEDLLEGVMTDPALLDWLDAPANRRAHPNENLARELMELFTLGVGNYQERDVKEAARALTGWTVENGAFVEQLVRHDDGEKTILGHTGQFRAPDVTDLLLRQPATARRLADRLCSLFMGEGVFMGEGLFMGEGGADENARASLANRLREDSLHIGRAVDAILRSNLFFSKKNLGTRITDPVPHVVGLSRAIELFDPPGRTLFLARWAASIGQELFFPPNVAGWPGGRAWLSSRTLVARTNFARALVDGRGVGRDLAADPAALARRHGIDADLDSLADFLAQLIHGHGIDDQTIKLTVDRAQSSDRPERELLAALLAHPRTHLC